MLVCKSDDHFRRYWEPGTNLVERTHQSGMRVGSNTLIPAHQIRVCGVLLQPDSGGPDEKWSLSWLFWVCSWLGKSLVVSETSSFQFFPEMENYSPIPLLKGKAKCGSVKLQFNLKVVLTFLHWKIDHFFHLPMHCGLLFWEFRDQLVLLRKSTGYRLSFRLVFLNPQDSWVWYWGGWSGEPFNNYWLCNCYRCPEPFSILSCLRAKSSSPRLKEL